jgi:hypothetical protein
LLTVDEFADKTTGLILRPCFDSIPQPRDECAGRVASTVSSVRMDVHNETIEIEIPDTGEIEIPDTGRIEFSMTGRRLMTG